MIRVVGGATAVRVTAGGGRRLDVRVSGPKGAAAVVHHHGTPGACVQMRSTKAAVSKHGLRLEGHMSWNLRLDGVFEELLDRAGVGG